MKKSIIISVIVVLVILLVIATLYYINITKYSKITVTSKEIQDKITMDLGQDMPAMVELDKEGLTDIYKINDIEIENFDIKIPMMNIKVDEIAVIKVKNVKDVENIKGLLSKRCEDVSTTFEQYLPEQSEIAKNPLIKSKGNYVIMSMSELNKEIEEIFNSFFK